MIDMDFVVRKEQVAGLEFMQFQSDQFYVTLKNALQDHISEASGRSVLQRSVLDGLLKVLADYTGFENITVKFMDSGNLYMDTGYFAPGHVLNNKGVEMWLDNTDTTIYRWFTQNRDKIFKGGVDYKTGKVTGSFKTIPLELGINVNLNEYFEKKELAKWNVTVVDVLAGAITHEMGHAFGGCMMMMTQFEDNVVATAAITAYRKASRPEDRVVILKDSATLLGLKPAKTDELMEFAKQPNDESFMLYFTKMTNQRNNQRSLSVGVPEMTSEVVADMYAIRMGCDKGIIAAIGVLTNRGAISTFFNSFFLGLLVGLWSSYVFAFPYIILGVPFGPAVPIAALVVSMLTFVLSYFSADYSGVYNADHRRLEDAVRQMIAKLKESKTVPSDVKVKMINEITQLLKLISERTPWYDNTFLYRAIGWVFSGSDFKLREIEHFTQALNNNEMVVLGEQLKGV